MKNTIKKIATVAMAFVLLGTGTTVTKTISPKSDNTIVADAASCKHKCRSYVNEYVLLTRYAQYKHYTSYKVIKFKTTKCSNCNKPIKPEEKCNLNDFDSKTNFGHQYIVYSNWEKFKSNNRYEGYSQYASKSSVVYDGYVTYKGFYSAGQRIREIQSSSSPIATSNIYQQYTYISENTYFCENPYLIANFTGETKKINGITYYGVKITNSAL